MKSTIKFISRDTSTPRPQLLKDLPYGTLFIRAGAVLMKVKKPARVDWMSEGNDNEPLLSQPDIGTWVVNLASGGVWALKDTYEVSEVLVNAEFLYDRSTLV